MHLSPNNQLLPKCFPVGARYVIEGCGGQDGDLQVIARYVVLPTGRRINVPVDLARTALPPVSAPRRSRAPRKAQENAKAGPAQARKKIIGRRGTTR